MGDESQRESRWAPPEGLTVDNVLGPGGALSGALEGYEHRPAQLEMARQVKAAFDAGRFLLAEAGTGTGKTLAYLVPALLSGKRVVISTATRTLQEQIFARDLPLLRDQVGLPVTAALLKGRNNYLCAARFERFEQQPLFSAPDDARHWDDFHEWALRTETGDRAETTLPDDWATWFQVSTTSESCTGARCQFYEQCFVTRARRGANDCQLIVVNHALFFADLALKLRGTPELELGVLPSYDAVVFDEAHALEDVATEYFGLTASSGRLANLATDIIARTPGTDPRAATLTALALELRTRSERFFQSVIETLSPPEHTRVDVLEKPDAPPLDFNDLRLLPDTLAPAKPYATRLLETLGAIGALCPEDDVDLGPFHRRALESALALDLTVRAEDPAQVYWASTRGRTLSLRAAPIDVGESLSKYLYDTVDSVVFTSATLRTARGGSGGSAGAGFDYTVARLGLEGRAWEALELQSPFDYAKQALFYVPGYLPEPSSPEWTLQFAREVFQLLRLSGGRAFVLFTSLRHMDEVHGLVSPHLQVPVLKQGDAPRKVLLERFVSAPSVLFASQSFWEGVDVPGDALSMVIIDRLPFSPPNEPLQAARMDAVRDAGGRPFDDFQVPQAALALRQGFGRLIRTARDRGVVALGDSRILRKRYGARFFESLPPVRRVVRFDDVRTWWNEGG
ncbi:MAG: ATP-dependent DNA helicase [Myxococcaceae bacterium]